MTSRMWPKSRASFVDMGFKLVATHGTADVLEEAGMAVERVYKVKEGRPNVVDLIKAERIQLIVNTPHGPRSLLRRESDPPGRGHRPHPDHYHALRRPRRRGRHRRPAARRSARASFAALACGAYSERPKRVAFTSEVQYGAGK